MEKITLKYECPESGNDGDIKDTITMEFDSYEMSIWDFVDRLKKFTLAIGYAPVTVERGFREAE
jgi:hypothetical protein